MDPRNFRIEIPGLAMKLKLSKTDCVQATFELRLHPDPLYPFRSIALGEGHGETISGIR